MDEVSKPSMQVQPAKKPEMIEADEESFEESVEEDFEEEISMEANSKEENDQ